MTKSERRHVTPEFRREAALVTQTSGRTVDRAADDPGPGRSTRKRWRTKVLEAEPLAGPHADPAKELARLRKENELPRRERDLLKKATVFFAREGNR